MKAALSALVTVVVLGGCGGFIDRQAASTTLRILAASETAARQLGDVEGARAALAGGIVQLEAFAIAYPHERRFAELHADAVCDFATAFVFDDWEDASLGGRTEEARLDAIRLDGMLGDCVALEQARLPAGWSAATLGAADVPAALAIARARAVRIAIAPIAGLAALPSVRELLERCAQLRPGYHDADAELLLGTLAAGVSAFSPGGDDGAAWFARASTLAGPGVLIVDLMRARAMSMAHQDHAALTAALTRVTTADLTRWPEHRLSNTLAVRKARRYLASDAAATR